MSIRTTDKINMVRIISAVLFICVAVSARAQTQDTGPSVAGAGQKPVSPIELFYTNLEFINQDGDEKYFYNDLLKGKTIIINSFFTSCKNVCPITMGVLASLQKHFAEKMGKELYIVSISVDPEVDTPSTLKDYAANLKTGPGWQLLTGNKKNIATVLKRIFPKNFQYSENLLSHNNTFHIVNASTGLQKEMYVLNHTKQTETLAAIVSSVLNDEGIPVKN